MAPVMSMCRASCRPGQSLLNSKGARSSQPRSVAARATPDERCNAAIATLSAASLLVGAAAPALAADLSVASSPAPVVAGQPATSKTISAVSAPSVLFETADLNADVRDTATDYRDPAIAVPQDKVADKLPSSSDLPDLSNPDKLDVGGVTANAGKTLSKGMFGSDKSSALPAANPLAAVADLNADVRDAADSYRDPAIAVPQDKVADQLSGSSISTPSLNTPDVGDKLSSAADDAASKAKSIFGSGSSSALPTNPLAAVADQNADVRDAADGYRDPAIAVPQDSVPDILEAAKSKTGTSSNIGDKVTGAADDAKDKAKGLLKGKGISALPGTNPLAAVADQNADVRDAAVGYRDPAGAVQLDAASDALKKAKSQAGGSDIAGAAADAKDKAKGLLKGKGISALPGANPLAAVADQNADVRDAAVGYRDPAGAVQLDAASDALKKAKSQAGGSDIAGAASDAKDKAKGLLKGKGISALPGANPLAAVADLNRDVRGDAEDYRDPAGAIQQDNAAGAVKSALKGNTPSISTPSLSKAGKQARKAGEKITKQVGVTNTVRSGRPVYPISGAKLNKPLVQDSVGRSFK